MGSSLGLPTFFDYLVFKYETPNTILFKMKQDKTIHINLTIDDERVQLFFSLLGKGFQIRAQMGCSIRDFLCQQLGLSPEYIEERIQTVFLNGKAVDDLDAASINPDAVLALSGAMPGLAGATLRRGGALSKMRGEISHVNENACRPGEEGKVTLKLFNLALKDLGPMFLHNGIWIDGKDLHHFFKQPSDHFWTGCPNIEIDEKPADAATLKNIKRDDSGVFLKLLSPSGSSAPT